MLLATSARAQIINPSSGGGSAPAAPDGAAQVRANSTTLGAAPDIYASFRSGADDGAKIQDGLTVSNVVWANFTGSPSWASGLTFAANQIVHFYPGYFPTVGARILMGSGDQLCGGGSSSTGGTVFNAKNGLNANVIDINNGTGFNQWHKLCDFQVTGNSANQASGYGVNLEGGGETSIWERILVQDAKQGCFRFAGNLAGSFHVSQLGAFGCPKGYFLDGITSVFKAINLKGDTDPIFLDIKPGGSCSVNILWLQWENGGDPAVHHDGTTNACSIAINGLYSGGGAARTDLFKFDNGNQPSVDVFDLNMTSNYTNVINNTISGYVLRKEKFANGPTQGVNLAFFGSRDVSLASLSFRRTDVAMNAGTNVDRVVGIFTRLTGTAGAGFANFGGPNFANCGNACFTEGATLRIYNPFTSSFYFTNEDASASPQGRFNLLTGQTMTIPASLGGGMANFIYHNNQVILGAVNPCTRTTNVMVCVAPTGHGFLSGQVVTITLESDCGTTIDGNRTLTAVSATSITFASAGANESCGDSAMVGYGRWLPGGAPWPLPAPLAAVTGGVFSKDCTGIGHVLSINTDGSETCSADVTTLNFSSYDNFNRANGGLGANWTTITGIVAPTITSNQVLGNTATTNQGAIYTATTFPNDQFSQATVPVGGNNANGAYTVDVRTSNAAWSGYECQFYNGNFSLVRYDAGVQNVLTTVAGSMASGDVLRITVVGTTLTCFQITAGVVTAVSTTTDAMYASGYPGFHIYGNVSISALDNWSAGAVLAPATLNTEQDWTAPQHFLGPVTVGITAPTAGTLPAGSFAAQSFYTSTNCADSAGAAACGSAAAGSFVIDATTTSTVVSTTAVTANSQIFLQYDSSLGTRLGITCNVTVALPVVTARTAGTSFTVTVPVAPITNPACYNYHIVN